MSPVGAIDELDDYFSKNDVEIPKEVNPAEFMIDVVSGDLSKGRDWDKVWLESPNCKQMMEDIEKLKEENKGRKSENEDDKYEYASTTGMQLKLVTKRASVQVGSRFCPRYIARLTPAAVAKHRIYHE
jgi:ATP-binding cassette subfamily G (WHITE) protein 2 (SNQ2)